MPSSIGISSKKCEASSYSPVCHRSTAAKLVKKAVLCLVKNRIKFPLPRQKRFSLAKGKSNILRLNDDCLLEIFSSLSTSDLCTAKRLCRRFSTLSDYVVRQRFKNQEEIECDVNEDNLHEQSAILRNFGKFIEGKLIIKLDPSNGAHGICSLLDHCTALRKLSLVNVDLAYVPLTGRFSQNLEYLSLKNTCGPEILHAELINRCPKLKTLLFMNSLYCLTDNILAYIARETSNIENIWFRPHRSTDDATFVTNVAQLCKLPNLRNFILMCNYTDMAPAIEALAAKNSLQKLTLFDVVPNERLVRALAQFTDLRFVFYLFKNTWRDCSRILELFREFNITKGTILDEWQQYHGQVNRN